MDVQQILREVLQEQCSCVHNSRLEAVLDVAEGLQNSQNMSMAAIGRNLSGEARIKHKIKKVDRCVGNKILHKELGVLFGGLSHFIFKYIGSLKEANIIIDLCYLKNDRTVQMLSAQLAIKGRSLPLYHEVFVEGELKGRVESFIANIAKMIPQDKKVTLIMDAGFHEEWFQAAENRGWCWLCRIRQGRDLKLEDNWISVKDFIPTIKEKTMEHEDVLLTKSHSHKCRIITTRKASKGRKQKVSRGKTTSKTANGSYSAAAKEPWILATNLPKEEYNCAKIVVLYSKRMQIEETFREIKSHQFGLSGRYIRTDSVHRWGVLMLLATITIICYWVIGVIAYSQDMQKFFQCNNKKDTKVFSYITLGKFVIEFNRLHYIIPSEKTLQALIDKELQHA